MNTKSIDPEFGEMEYKHRWQKKVIENFWGKDFEITVVARSYSEKPITDEQRNSYSYYKSNKEQLMNVAADLLTDYIKPMLEEKADCNSSIESAEDLLIWVTPKSLIFKQDGTTLVLFDFSKDVENGICIQLTPNFDVGIQSVFL